MKTQHVLIIVALLLAGIYLQNKLSGPETKKVVNKPVFNRPGVNRR